MSRSLPRRLTLLALALSLLVGCSGDPAGVSDAGRTDSGGSSDVDSGLPPSDASSTELDASTEISDASVPPLDAHSAPDAGREPDGGFVDPPDPPAPTVQFMWPTDGWIAANHNYYMRGVHSGSADIGAAYGTPVVAARAGRVTSAAWTEIGGYLVIIDHGDSYSTLYSHLMNTPSVAVGDRVTAGQRLGVLGRTGNAFSNGAHLHFSIRRGTERLVIPGLEYGSWVRRGQRVAGTYGSLSTFRAVAPPFDVEIVDDGVPAFASPSQSSGILDMLSAGEVLEATRSEDGYYRVTLDSGRHGWVVHTATTPRGVHIEGKRITAMEANIRRTPSVSGAQLGTISNGELVTTFEQRGEWFRLLFGVPTVYGWTHETNVAATAQHRASIRAPSANLRSAPSITSPSVGSLSFTSSFVVLERRHGWYRLRHDGADVWVAGWLTGGRL